MSTSPPGGDLTGVWQCDDGGLYYIRQSVDGTVVWAGLQDSGFHKGMEFTNVFYGSLSDDGYFIYGDWADVPRGGTVGSGTLGLAIWDDASGRRLLRVDDQTTGGFGGSAWFPTGSLLEPQNIIDLTGRVQRYDVPLGQNNPPCRDFTVMWGSVFDLAAPTLPPNDDYCSFVAKDIIGQPTWNGDGDFTFNFRILWETQYANGTDIGDFWNNGWLTRQVDGMLPVTLMAQLYEAHGHFHCEAAMYGRENSGSECTAAPVNLLPGWAELSGWSVLVNGRPIAGALASTNNDPDNLVLSFGDGPGGTIQLADGAVVRVIGVVAFDAGHPKKRVKPEIHPVYSIDIQQQFDLSRAQPVTLSGVWHGSDNGTYYIRQLGSTVWWLGLSRDQGRSFANVFRGSISESGPLVGEWIDVQMGVGGVLSGGTLTLQGNQSDTELSTTLTKTAESASFGAAIWTKIYDTDGMPVSRPVIESAE
jgi:hypothetical protein